MCEMDEYDSMWRMELPVATELPFPFRAAAAPRLVPSCLSSVRMRAKSIRYSAFHGDFGFLCRLLYPPPVMELLPLSTDPFDTAMMSAVSIEDISR